ncbi:MAG: FAD-dependent oxidoreductase [Proteobacteria bacterium]|nr:FAD-dependent oxidoreductase [Pseudomonadota bacterium]MBU4037134.1 FAD-dependent oxidoreductase [Pseudomonadota bacterium]
MSDQFQYLFTPFKIGPVTIKNRIFFPAHGTKYTDESHMMTQRYVEYQRARAKGGVGLIVAGSMNIMFNSRNIYGIMEMYDERIVERLKTLVEAVHAEGAKLFVQLMHAGRTADTELTQMPLWSASPTPAGGRAVPKEMEIEDIKEVIAAYAKTAQFAKDAGLDGLEIHSATGYLPEQFMSPYTNKRTDEYGGSLENRVRFPLEVMAAIREQVGYDMALGIRMPGDEFVPGGLNIDDTTEIGKIFEESGYLDYISISGGFYEGIFTIGTGMHTPLGLLNPYAARFKESVDLAIGVALRINDPIQAEKMLAEGQTDLVGMCRALIADPELPKKAMEGRIDEIRSCIACNQGCIGRAMKGRPLTCFQNPVTGKEKEIGTIEPAKTKKKVMVIGGGLAGMETARVAKLRGHDVTLYETANELGGQILIAAKAPNRAEIAGSVRYRVRQLELLGVKVNLGVTVTPQMVEKEAPDAVVVATGSLTAKSPVPGGDQDNVVNVWDVLSDKVELGENVIVVDGGEGHWQFMSTAEYIVQKGKQVEMVSALTFIGFDLIATTDLPASYIRLRSKGAVFSPNTIVKSISGNTVELIDIYAGAVRKVEGVDNVVMVTHNRANNELYKSLKGKVKELHCVGDCVAPRKGIDAIYDGYTTGIKI